MGKEVALSLFNSLVMNALVESPDFLNVIHFLLAFQLISAAVMTLMQQSSVVSVHHTAGWQYSVNAIEFGFILQVLMNVLKEQITVERTLSVLIYPEVLLVCAWLAILGTHMKDALVN